MAESLRELGPQPLHHSRDEFFPPEGRSHRCEKALAHRCRSVELSS